jgi:hypothetical protein
MEGGLVGRGSLPGYRLSPPPCLPLKGVCYAMSSTIIPRVLKTRPHTVKSVEERLSALEEIVNEIQKASHPATEPERNPDEGGLAPTVGKHLP